MRLACDHQLRQNDAAAKRKLTCNDPSKCLQEKNERKWREKGDKVVTEVFVCVCVCVRTSHCTEEVLKFLSLLFPHENWPPSFFLSALQIVLFSLQHSFPPSCTNECRVALSTCWGLKACGIRLFTANEFKDSITASTEQARHSSSHRARCRCVIERNCFLKCSLLPTYWDISRRSLDKILYIN